jgi:hypothetical protein
MNTVTYRHNGVIKWVKNIEEYSKDVPSNVEPASWKELHQFKPSDNQSDNERFLLSFNSRVPNVNCPCRAEWTKFVSTNPVRFDDWFRWTVEAHNSVNQRLGKPILSLEQAKELWLTE